MLRKDYLRKLIANYVRRLQKLKEQHASFGLHTPPHILNEIEDIEDAIKELSAELNVLTSQKKGEQEIQRIRVKSQKPQMMPSVFVGRSLELLKLDGWLATTLSGQPQMVFVSGEAGVGKTHLVEEFVRRAHTTHPKLTSATGYCNSYFGKVAPFNPFRSIFSQLFGSEEWLDPADTTSSVQTADASLSEVPPDIVEGLILGVNTLSHSAVPSTDSIQVRTMLFEQFSRLLLRISQKTPLLLILEDLHWADNSTVDLLFYLARDWNEQQQLMIVGTYREGEVLAAVPEHPLLQVERELRRYELCQKLRVVRLEESAVQDWLNQLYPTNRFPGDFAQWLQKHTRGNALFVSQILKDLEEQNCLYRVEEGVWVLSSKLNYDQNLPDNIAAVLDRRLARLEKQLRDLLTCASVEGEEFTAQVIAAVRKVDEEEVLDALSEILDRRFGLVTEKEERQTMHHRLLSLFEFRHAFMRAHLYSSLQGSLKRRLHQKVGECLEMLYGEVTAEVAPALAHHFAQAKNAQKTVRYALLAADFAEKSYDYKAAGSSLRLAIDNLAVLDSNPLMLADVWNRLGRVEHLTNSFNEAELCFRRGLDYLQQTQADDKKANLLHNLANCYIQIARSPEAILLLKEALSLNRRLGRKNEAAHNLVSLAFAHHKSARQDLANTYLLRAAEGFESLDDPVGRAEVYRHLGINFRIEGNFELSEKYLREAARLDHETGNRFSEASDYTNLGSTYLELADDHVQALTYYEKSLEISREISKVHEEAHVLLNIARLLSLRSDWAQASENVEEGLRLSGIVHQTSNIIRGHWYRGLIRFHQGNVDGALQDFEHVLQIGACDARARWALLCNLGSLILETGNIKEAMMVYHEACKVILEIVHEIPVEQHPAFFKQEQKINVFRALSFTAERADQPPAFEVDLPPVVAKMLAEISGQSFPRFYWGGGKWT